jgi:hypothetical protein
VVDTINDEVGANDVAATVAFDGFGNSFGSLDDGSVETIVVCVSGNPIDSKSEDNINKVRKIINYLKISDVIKYL